MKMIQWSMINFQWSAISAFLIGEIIFATLLLLPWINPKIWHAFFHSKPIQKFGHWKYTRAGLRIGALGMVLFLCDAIRDVYAHAHTYTDVAASMPAIATADKDALMNMHLYRAERNFLVVAFSLFFAMLIKRLIGLICLEAEMMANANEETLDRKACSREIRSGAKEEVLDKLTKAE